MNNQTLSINDPTASTLSVSIVDPESNQLTIRIGETGPKGAKGDKGDRGEAIPLWLRVENGYLQWFQGDIPPDNTWQQADTHGVYIKGEDGNDGVDLTNGGETDDTVYRLNTTISTRDPFINEGVNGDVWFSITTTGE